MLFVCMIGVSGLSTDVQASYMTPRLVVTGADIPGDVVTAGETFELTLHLRNESTRSALVNITLKLSTPDNMITTESGSNSLYIDRIPINSDYDVTVTMKADEKLTDKACALTVSYS